MRHFDFDPLRAARAIAALLRDPDDTAQVFTIIESLSGSSRERVFRRFAAGADGARLLAERPDLVAILSSRDRLRAMPEGSLGRAYLAFVESEGITADGLVAASHDGESGSLADADRAWVHTRMRDTHDLWHTVTGYSGDVLGEAALLAFSFAQTANPGIGLIVLTGLVRIALFPRAPERAPKPGARSPLSLVVDGFRRGRRAAWLPDVPWERLLELPLDEVRARLALDGPPDYERVRTSELREMGALAPRAAA